METISKIQEKRKQLIELSVKARKYKEEQIQFAETPEEVLFWTSININRLLINYFYETNGATEFKTFHDWKKQDAIIKKGEKAFLIWGQPRKASKTHEPINKTQEPTEEQYEFWPICFLFSNKQVYIQSQEEPYKPQKKETEQLVPAYELD